MLLVGLALAVSLGGSQTIVTYRAQHRPAAELLALAESALGADGAASLDARTATLILNGAAEAVKRTLELLEQLDRPLATVVLTSEIRDASELEERGLRVDWRATPGPLAIGTLPLGSDGVRVALGAGASASRSRSRSTLRLLEGANGVLITGEALPLVYRSFWGAKSVDFLPVETGFEATATRLGDGRVQLELRPFSGRLAPSGELQYTQAATSLAVAPGTTVVVGEVSGSTDTSERRITGATSEHSRERRMLLVTVELEEP